jgi:nitrite reductase (NADH) small subunit
MTQLTQITNPDWLDVGPLEAIPLRGSRRVKTTLGWAAVFRTGEDKVFALMDRCPHKQGPLSSGIVHGNSVTCPLHGFVIDLATGEPTGADKGTGCTPTLPIKRVEGRVLIRVALSVQAANLS